MKNPLVSVVIPVYNTEKYIVETIDSVISQTYGEWELLLVDDGSTDGSLALMQEIAAENPKIRVISKPNGGQASARNKGIQEAKGELIAFMDSDDLWLPNKLEDQIKDWNEINPDFMYGLGYFLHQETKELESYDWITGKRSGMDFFNELFISSAVNTNTVLVRKSIFDTVGYFDESRLLIGVEDWDMWLRIALEVDLIYGSEQRNVYYRLHAGGIHFQNARMLTGKWEVLKKHLESPHLPQWKKEKQIRYISRELINLLYATNEKEKCVTVLKEYHKFDKGTASRVQAGLLKVLPLGLFIWTSKNILYRIAYRLEKKNYYKG